MKGGRTLTVLYSHCCHTKGPWYSLRRHTLDAGAKHSEPGNLLLLDKRGNIYTVWNVHIQDML